MSMIGNLLQVSQAELEDYLNDSSLLEKRIYSETSSDDPNHLDIEKSWEGIFYLLTGQSVEGIEDAKPPLVWILLGDKMIDETQDLGYGPASYIDADQVKEVHNALQKISEEEFKAGFDPEKMTELGVYPEIWDEGEEAYDYLVEYFKQVKVFYEKAVKDNHAMINFIN